MRAKVRQIRDWYERYEGRISSFSLLFGFVFDSITLQRIDALRENLWITINLVVAAACIILLNRRESKDPKKHFWFYTILQFTFGSMLGAFFIFYFQSSTLSVSWPFLAILLAAMIGNEVFKKHYERQIFQISFLYLALLAFMIFLLPILLHRIGALIFVTSGIASLIAIWGFMKLLGQLYWRPVIIIFIFVNILYFANIIPPIPLSLKDAGIYHGVVKTSDGTYQVVDENRGVIEKIFSWNDRVRWVKGETLYALSSVYSPADLDVNIFHEWQYYDEDEDKWMTRARIPLRLSGGRVEGFRTFSNKSNLASGFWRVNVETGRGQLLGRIKFKIMEVEVSPSFRSIKVE